MRQLETVLILLVSLSATSGFAAAQAPAKGDGDSRTPPPEEPGSVCYFTRELPSGTSGQDINPGPSWADASAALVLYQGEGRAQGGAAAASMSSTMTMGLRHHRVPSCTPVTMTSKVLLNASASARVAVGSGARHGRIRGSQLVRSKCLGSVVNNIECHAFASGTYSAGTTNIGATTGPSQLADKMNRSEPGFGSAVTDYERWNARAHVDVNVFSNSYWAACRVDSTSWSGSIESRCPVHGVSDRVDGGSAWNTSFASLF